MRHFTAAPGSAGPGRAVAGWRPGARLGPLPARRVLIADDNRDAADVLGALLRALGLTVAVAYSGSDALALLGTFEPDLMLLDIGMPDMDGYVLARRVRALDQGARVVLVAVTGWGQPHDVMQARDAGFDHHLVKPPDIDRLRELVLSANRRGQ